MNAAEFRELVAQIEAWEAVEAPPDYTELQDAPFYSMVNEYRLSGPVWKLRQKPTPTQQRWLWAIIRTRLAELVSRGAPGIGADGRPTNGEWEIEIPAAYPLGWLNANNRSANHKVEAARRAEWRRHAYQYALKDQHLLPRGLTYVKTEIVFQVKTYGLRDNANLNPTAKPIIDAFGPDRTYQRRRGNRVEWVRETGLGVYVGDDAAHLAGPSIYFAPDTYTGPLDGIATLRIIDLSPLQGTPTA